MIEHNSEVYNHPYISFFIVHVYMEEDLCRGDCILHCYVRSSLLFPYFLPFWYPYILIHFECFLLLVIAVSLIVCNDSVCLTPSSYRARKAVHYADYQLLYTYSQLQRRVRDVAILHCTTQKYYNEHTHQ